MIIDKYNFSKADYLALRQNPEYLRTYELNAILRSHRNRVFNKILELGCGRGAQSHLLKSYGSQVIATDANDELLPKQRDEPSLTFMSLDAQNMDCFADRQFDLILSSNLLEHLPDIEKCLSECRRVLTKDGIVIHAVPNITWKIFYLLLYYPVLAKQLGRKLMRPSISVNHAASPALTNDRRLDDNLKRMEKRSYFNKIIPKTHGRCSSHIREFLEWRQQEWLTQFTQAGFIARRIVHLPFYYGHGLEYEAIHRMGNIIGLSGSTAYELSVE